MCQLAPEWQEYMDYDIRGNTPRFSHTLDEKGSNTMWHIACFSIVPCLCFYSHVFQIENYCPWDSMTKGIKKKKNLLRVDDSLLPHLVACFSQRSLFCGEHKSGCTHMSCNFFHAILHTVATSWLKRTIFKWLYVLAYTIIHSWIFLLGNPGEASWFPTDIILFDQIYHRENKMSLHTWVQFIWVITDCRLCLGSRVLFLI